MEKKDIASLLDALCERPMAEETDPLPPEQAELYRRALEALAREGGSEGAARLAQHPEALAAVLAAIHAGEETAAEREAFARAAAGSADIRLDSESALAFLSGIHEAPEAAPAHLVAALETSHATPAPRRWSLASLWPARRTSWRWAAAFAVLVVAGGLSWSTFRQGDDTGEFVPPAATTQSDAVLRSGAAVQSDAGMPPSAMAGAARAPIIQTMPNEPEAAALAKPCEVGETALPAGETNKPATARPSAPTSAANKTACDDTDRQLADKDGKAAKDLEALRRKRAAVEAEIARREAELAANRKAAAEASPGQPGEVGAAASPRPSFGYGAADSAVTAVPPAAGLPSPSTATVPPAGLPNR